MDGWSVFVAAIAVGGDTTVGDRDGITDRSSGKFTSLNSSVDNSEGEFVGCTEG